MATRWSRNWIRSRSIWKYADRTRAPESKSKKWIRRQVYPQQFAFTECWSKYIGLRKFPTPGGDIESLSIGHQSGLFCHGAITQNNNNSAPRGVGSFFNLKG